MNWVIRSAIVLGLYLFIAVGEVGLHWYAGTQDSAAARVIRNWYLYHDPYSGKTPNGGSADYYVPAMLLGFMVGYLLGRQSIAEVTLWGLLMSAGIVVLYPLYVTFFPKGTLPWSESVHEVVAGLSFKFVTIVLTFGVFAFAGRTLLRRTTMKSI